jgi:hypothetical protein
MRLPPLNPRQIRELAVDGVDAAQRAMSTAPRLAALLDAAEVLLERTTRLVSRIEQAEARAAKMLERYEPALHDICPAVVRLSETLGDGEIDDLITVIRRAPRLTQEFTDDIIPVVETLKTIAPDLTELLATSRTLNEIVGSVPGLGRVKKRVDEESQQTD